VTATGGQAAGEAGPAERLGFRPGMTVQELGWADDVDDDLRDAIEDITGEDLVDEDFGDLVDGVVLWWRDGDGDLVDALMDTQTLLTDGGVIWLFTPKVGRGGHVDPADIAESAPTAGLSTPSSVATPGDWAATRLVARRGGSSRK